VYEKSSDAQGAFIEVPTKQKSQKPILCGRFESESITRESLEDNDESLQFFHYG